MSQMTTSSHDQFSREFMDLCRSRQIIYHLSNLLSRDSEARRFKALATHLQWRSIRIEVETFRAVGDGPLPGSHKRMMAHLRAIAAIEGKRPSPNW